MFEGQKFGSWNKFNFTPSGKLLEINYYNVGKKSAEEIEQDLEEGSESINFGFYGSAAPLSKNNNEEDKSGSEGKNKKPNK